jgi:hypothetical protein
MVDYKEGPFKADRKVWSDLCKYQLGQEVNIALNHLATHLTLRLLRRFWGRVWWCGAVRCGGEQREE